MKYTETEVYAKLWYENGKQAAWLTSLDPVPPVGRDLWMKQAGMIQFRVTYWNGDVWDEEPEQKVYVYPRVVAIRGTFVIEYVEPKTVLTQVISQEDENA